MCIIEQQLEDRTMLQEETYFIAESFLTETVHVSFHRRTPTQMAGVHKAVLNTNNHSILHHETTGDGSHVIHHLTPSKKVRTTVISSVSDRKGMASKITDKPASPEDAKKFGPRS